jgi:spore maturation protein B
MPLIIFIIVVYGMLTKTDVYDNFVEGAKDGMKTVVGILPTLIGLMVAVGILRASGFLDFLSRLLGMFTVKIGFPSELVPLVIVRMFSSSAATGLALDLFKQFGTDSFIGLATSIILSCTETIFYTMSVYFLAAKVKKTRWTLTGALIATFVGIVISVILARAMAMG